MNGVFQVLKELIDASQAVPSLPAHLIHGFHCRSASSTWGPTWFIRLAQMHMEHGALGQLCGVTSIASLPSRIAHHGKSGRDRGKSVRARFLLSVCWLTRRLICSRTNGEGREPTTTDVHVCSSPRFTRVSLRPHSGRKPDVPSVREDYQNKFYEDITKWLDFLKKHGEYMKTPLMFVSSS